MSRSNEAMKKTTIDVVVAVRDEEETIPPFVERIDALALPPNVELRMLFVEDSSSDGTRPLLRDLAAERSDVGYAFLRKGYGQGIAVSYGLSLSNADAVVMMDVDGSHPPEAIADLVDAFQGGAEVVQCVRRSIVDRRVYRNLGTAGFHAISRIVFGLDISDQNVFFRLISANVAEMILAEPRDHFGLWLPSDIDLRSLALSALEPRPGTEGEPEIFDGFVASEDSIVNLLSTEKLFLHCEQEVLRRYRVAPG